MTRGTEYRCHICGQVHKMALTPFPMEPGWPCPYLATQEAYDRRVALIKVQAAIRAAEEAR